MKIEIDTKVLASYSISVNEYVLLYLLYYKNYDTIKELYTKSSAINIISDLYSTSNFLLSKDENILEVLLSKKEVEKLLNIKTDNINFWEFYNCYPVKVGTRVLRASGPTSQLALKHEKKYISKVKTEIQHQKAINAITTFVAKQKMSGKLEYLPGMEVVLNNSLWEVWESLIDKKGQENGTWNSETI